MSITKADAAWLVENIRSAKVAGHAIAARHINVAGIATAAFLGGLESVLCHFLHQQGRGDTTKALIDAMNREPTADEIAARRAQIESLGKVEAA